MLWTDGERVFSRTWREADNGERTGVLAVMPAAEPPTSGTLDRLAHEYDLSPELDRAWAARPLELVREPGRVMLLLEDPGGEPLELLLGSPIAVGRFLPLAIAIAEALAKVHRRGLVHMDVQPANILVDQVSGQVRLTGFGFACRLSREYTVPAATAIAGTLAYMAPEQTGRMNRPVDTRSDLYALGVTFYRMLAGVLPFTAEDAAELVHSHMARRPAPPDEWVRSLPAAISAIVMRLLAKTSEERYQTAAGVVTDLRRCLGEWEASGTIALFAPGAHDIPEALRISGKLYGREREIRALRAAFERAVARGTPELVLVSGYSGIGKSAIANQLKAVVLPRGLFASGKFDQHQRDIPYTTVAHALQDLTQQLLVKTDDELAVWRKAMTRALGMHGRLVVDLVPDLELLIGPQPPVPDLPPREAENRLLGVLGGFLGVFARTRPLVLFLDDLQWLDAATLKFLAHIVTRPNGGSLLVIGAYRDNEVGPAHPLLLTLESVRQAGAKVTEIALGPLSRDDLCRMVADAAGSETREVEEFARLVQSKTAGNPFFAIQFLKALWEERLFTFDAAHGAWIWDIHDIQSRGFTDNVIDLMVGKLRRLPAATQDALQLFACVGSSADVATLAITRGGTEPAVHADLSDAVREELVLRRGDSYQFFHDRVQEAAYALIPEDRRPEAHLRIGRLLLSQCREEPIQERVFEVVNQLNRGAALITDPSEKEQLKQLNGLAGRRAKNAIAYASARSYLTRATALLGPDAWTAQYEDTFALLMERCECEYLTGNFQAAEDLSAAILENASSAVDRARVYRLRLRQSESAGRYEDALFVMRDALRLFGIRLPESDEAMQAATETEAREIAINLQGRRVSDLADTPTADDPTAKAIISLIAESMSHDHVTAQWLPFLAAKGVNICLRHGNTGESSVVYDGYARALVGAGDFQSAFEFSEMALRLAAKFDNPRLQTLVLERHAFFVSHWRHHFATSLQYINRCFDAYVKLGDFYACYAAFHLIEISIERSCLLDDLLKTCRKYVDFAAQSYNDALVDTLLVQQEFIASLTERTRAPTSMDDGAFQANRLAALAIRRYYVLNQQLLFLFGRYDEALEFAERAATVLRWRDNLLICATHRFYRALTLAELYPRASAGRQQEFRRILSEELLRHRNWADNCPENFANRYFLLAAEVARIDGQDLEAMRCYEQAIRSARDNGFIQNQALANELAGRFYLDQGLETNGYAHLRNARADYAEWGAGAKVVQLEQRHPRLAAPDDDRPASIGSAVQQLDVTAVVRASQAVSSEIVLPNLVEQLMRIALQNAGADHGLLVLREEDGFHIVAEARASGDRVEVRLCHVTIEASCCPQSVLRYVVRTHKSVILDDISRAGLFSDDEYLQERRPKAVLCIPLVKQGRLAGLLYLENTLATHVFTAGRAAVLELLAAQAAISLENTRLYSDVQAREAKIRRLVDSNIIGITIGDSVGNISEANDAFLDILGYSRDDLNSGRVRWLDLTPPEWRLPTERAITELKQTGTCKPFEKEYIRKDGGRVPVLVGSVALDETRERSVAFVLDLTARKQAEYLTRQVFENSPDGIAVIGRDYRYRRVNPIYERNWGIPPERILGMHVADLRGIDDFEQTIKLRLDRCFAGEERSYAEWFIPPIGRRYTAVTYSPLRPNQESVEAALVIHHDLTEHELASEALREAQAKLAHINRVTAMGQLTSSIAHEVSQPIAAAITNAHAALHWLAARPPDLEEARQALSRIVRDGNRAGDVIGRIRALIKKAPPRTDPVDINEVILEVIALTHSEALRNGVALQTRLATSLPLIQGDRVQLEQVVLNLIINANDALKEVDERARVLTVSSESGASTGVRVAVSDSGPGLTHETRERLFEAFYTTKPGGIGMGLSICRSIIEAHGGTVWATANVPQGAVFQFTLPAHQGMES